MADPMPNPQVLHEDGSNLENILERQVYDPEQAAAALRGARIPNGVSFPVVRFAVIRGIRYHPSYGQELRGLTPEFTRALNARSIMSNKIPVMDKPEDVPYCIWPPDLATEYTYRQLVRV